MRIYYSFTDTKPEEVVKYLFERGVHAQLKKGAVTDHDFGVKFKSSVWSVHVPWLQAFKAAIILDKMALPGWNYKTWILVRLVLPVTLVILLITIVINQL